MSKLNLKPCQQSCARDKRVLPRHLAERVCEIIAFSQLADQVEEGVSGRLGYLVVFFVCYDFFNVGQIGFQ